jgi:hypothetical protein
MPRWTRSASRGLAGLPHERAFPLVRDWFEHPYERFDSLDNLDQISPPAASSSTAATG